MHCQKGAQIAQKNARSKSQSITPTTKHGATSRKQLHRTTRSRQITIHARKPLRPVTLLHMTAPSLQALATTTSLPSSTSTSPSSTSLLTTPKRSMAFSFDRPTSFYLSQQPVARAHLPWEKHTVSAEETVVKVMKSNHDLEPQLPSVKRNIPEQHNERAPDQYHSQQQQPLSFKSTKFSFSSITPQRTAPSATSLEAPATVPAHSDINNTLIPESRLAGRITAVMQPALEANKNADVSGVGHTDFETLFANSKFNGVFAQQQVGPSFWAKMTPDGPQQLYFVGSRQFINLSTGQPAAEPVYAFKKTTVNRQMRTIRDDFTTYSYMEGRPTSSTMVFSLEPDFSRGSVHDPNPNLPTGFNFRGAVRYRGVPWKWHASVQMGLVSCDPTKTNNPEPDTHHTHRTKFFADGYITEKLIRQGDRLTLSTVDEMKLVPKDIFDERFRAAMEGSHEGL